MPHLVSGDLLSHFLCLWSFTPFIRVQVQLPRGQLLTASKCTVFEADVPERGRNPHPKWLRNSFMVCAPLADHSVLFDNNGLWPPGQLVVAAACAVPRVTSLLFAERQRSHRMLISCCQPVLNYQCAWKINFQTSFILSELENNLFLSC